MISNFLNKLTFADCFRAVDVGNSGLSPLGWNKGKVKTMILTSTGASECQT